MCTSCLAQPQCGETVYTACVKNGAGVGLDTLLTGLQTDLEIVTTATDTSGLIRRTLPESSLEGLGELLQALIDRTEPTTSTVPTLAGLLDEPVKLSDTCQTEQCGGVTAQPVRQILLNLLSRVFLLENRVLALENNHSASVPYSYPQY